MLLNVQDVDFLYSSVESLLIPKAEEYIFSFLKAFVLVGVLVGSLGTAVPHNVKVNQNKFLSL